MQTKSYFRCAPGEPGGEMTATVTINRTKLWVDECDNRTHLTVGDSYGNAENSEETYTVQLREFCKNISHDSGLWYMDLGGGWYDDKGIMNNIASIVKASEQLRRKKHESRAEIMVIIDEKSVMLSHPRTVEAVESFLRNIQLCSAPIDIIYSFNIENADFSYAKTAIFLTPLCVSQKIVQLVKGKLGQNGTVIFASKTNYLADIPLIPSQNVLKPEFYISESHKINAVATDSDGRIVCGKTENGDLLISSLCLSVEEIRKILELTGVNFYAPKECTVYADNRIVSFFAREDMTFVPNVPGCTTMKNVMTGETVKKGEPIHIQAKRGCAFII